MKQYIVLLCALLFVISLNCVQLSFLKNTGNEMLDMLSVILTNIQNEDFESAKAELGILNDKWEGIRDRWDILTEHDDVEELESSLASIEAYVDNTEAVDAVVEVAVLKQRIEHIIQNETLSFSTIF